MHTPGLLLAGSLSFLPFALALASGGSLRIEGATWTALALLPWLALAGLPRAELFRTRAGASEPRGGWLLPVALALPGVALAIGLDARDAAVGRGTVLAGLVGATGLVLVGLWSLAARAAGDSRRAGTAYGVLWLFCVPGAAALIWALVWAPRGQGASATAGWAQALDFALPLPWLARWAERGAGGAAAEPLPLQPLLLGGIGNAGVVLALAGAVRLVRRAAVEERA